jgi:hypothetical protein
VGRFSPLKQAVLNSPCSQASSPKASVTDTMRALVQISCIVVSQADTARRVCSLQSSTQECSLQAAWWHRLSATSPGRAAMSCRLSLIQAVTLPVSTALFNGVGIQLSVSDNACDVIV